jgi:hypothetical protein
MKLLLAALTATALFAVAVSASANRFEISNFERGFRVVFSSLELSSTAGSEIVRCPVTIEGTWHQRTLLKTSGRLIGFITRAAIGVTEPPCSGGVARVLSESLPWHVRYESFTGTLPNITSLKTQIIGAAFQTRVTGGLGITCLALSSAAHPISTIIDLPPMPGPNGLFLAREVRVSASGIPLTGEGGICGLATGRIAGTGRPTILGSTEQIGIKLI